MGEPIAPENVRAIMADGSEVPMECTYEGYADGAHRWLAVWPLPERPKSIEVGTLPAHTSVAVQWSEW